VNEPPSFYAVNRTLVRGLVAACIALIAIAALLWLNARQRRCEAESQRFLANVSAALGASLDFDAAGAAVARMAVPRLADAALLYVDDGSGEPRAWLARADVAGDTMSIRVPATALPAIASRPGVAGALRPDRPVVTHSDAAQGWPGRLVHAGKVSTESTFPLVAGGRTLGTLSLASATRRIFGRDLALASELAHRAATPRSSRIALPQGGERRPRARRVPRERLPRAEDATHAVDGLLHMSQGHQARGAARARPDRSCASAITAPGSRPRIGIASSCRSSGRPRACGRPASGSGSTWRAASPPRTAGSCGSRARLGEAARSSSSCRANARRPPAAVTAG